MPQSLLGAYYSLDSKAAILIAIVALLAILFAVISGRFQGKPER